MSDFRHPHLAQTGWTLMALCHMATAEPAEQENPSLAKAPLAVL